MSACEPLVACVLSVVRVVCVCCVCCVCCECCVMSVFVFLCRRLCVCVTVVCVCVQITFGLGTVVPVAICVCGVVCFDNSLYKHTCGFACVSFLVRLHVCLRFTI